MNYPLLYLAPPRPQLSSSDYGYALAHECVDRKTITEYRHKHRVILDNGANELKEGLGGEFLAWLTGMIEPEFVILPDTLHNAPKTLEDGFRFLESMEKAPEGPKWIGVAQGKDIDDFLLSFETWLNDDRITRIGIPYDVQFAGTTELVYDENWSNRVNLVNFLTRVYNIPERKFHFLGSWEILELFRIMREPSLLNVRETIASYDTTAPYSGSAVGRSFHAGEEINFNGPKDWPGMDFNKYIDFEYLDWNIACCLASAKVSLSNWERYMKPREVEKLWPHFSHYYDEEDRSAGKTWYPTTI